MLPHPQNSFHLGTSAAIWSLRTSLQPGLILDKYRRNSWAHLNSLHLSFHKKVILSELFCSFLSWQKDLNEKSHKGSLLGKAAKKIELICFRYSPTTFTQFIFNFYLFSKLWPEFNGSHMQSQHKGGESQRITDFWDHLGYEFEAE